jgi:probable O-glycosylation ligase (exosortase A-associated)
VRDAVLLLATIVFSAVALGRPVAGMLAYVGYSAMAPHSLTWTISRAFPHVQVIAIATLIGYALWSEPKRLPRDPRLALLGVLWAMFGVSTLFAMEPDNAEPWFAHISKMLLMVLLIPFLITTESRLHNLLRVIALSLGFHAFKLGLFVLKCGGVAAVWGPEDSFLYANNSIGMALVMNTPILYYLAQVESRRWLRWMMRAMFFLSYPAVAGTFSRGAWVGLAVVTAVMILKSRYRMAVVAAAVIIAIMAPAWLPRVISPELAERYETLVEYESDASAESRFWNWEFCGRVGAGRPLSGGGFGYYSVQAYAQFFPEFLARWPGKVWSCHNMWLQVLSEHGVAAFAVWLGLLVSSFVGLRRVAAYAKTVDKPAWGLWAHGLQASLVGFMVTGTFLDIAYFEIYYQLLAVVAILNEVVRRHAIDPETLVPRPVPEATSKVTAKRGAR